MNATTPYFRFFRLVGVGPTVRRGDRSDQHALTALVVEPHLADVELDHTTGPGVRFATVGPFQGAPVGGVQPQLVATLEQHVRLVVFAVEHIDYFLPTRAVDEIVDFDVDVL